MYIYIYIRIAHWLHWIECTYDIILYHNIINSTPCKFKFACYVLDYLVGGQRYNLGRDRRDFRQRACTENWGAIRFVLF